ncbi:hypothetical protein WMY93_013494 [Mugilogobius chulae]|uniref:Methyltransferase like 21C n=1 Tax=Mugilogobius chulae TaxID=88201 RepID=A0AAW0P1W1_9GOBI
METDITSSMETRQAKTTKEKEASTAAENSEDLAKSILAHRFYPPAIGSEAWEGYTFRDLEIRIRESTDFYGAVLWPSAMVLCHFLEKNQDAYNLVDKNVIELGAGTGLVTIVASLLGAKMTSTDLPDLLGNLQYNVLRNTKNRCKKHVILWAMRFRLDPENSFVDRFRERFHLEELYDLPTLSIKLYRAWKRDTRTNGV